jgi:membrane-associated HD superfamily phosphohydrolase
MKATKKKSVLYGIPAWGLAGLALVVPVIFMILLLFLGDLVKMDERMNEDITDSVFYILYGIFIALICFYIVRQNPNTIWFVPILCNAVGIYSAIDEPTFWVSSLWMFICGGWVLSIIASIIGYYLGRRI